MDLADNINFDTFMKYHEDERPGEITTINAPAFLGYEHSKLGQSANSGNRGVSAPLDRSGNS